VTKDADGVWLITFEATSFSPYAIVVKALKPVASGGSTGGTSSGGSSSTSNAATTTTTTAATAASRDATGTEIDDSLPVLTAGDDIEAAEETSTSSPFETGVQLWLFMLAIVIIAFLAGALMRSRRRDSE